MGTARAFIAKHAVPVYLALTFVVSWGGLLVIGESSGSSGTAWQSDPQLPWLVMAMLAGPSVAGLLLTGIVSGRPGLRDVGRRGLRWRVGASWYAVALLTAPAVYATVHLVLSFASPTFLPTFPSVSSAAAFALGAFVVGFFEELGWTGFAIPRLRMRASPLATGLLVGVPWGAWHLVTNDFWIASTFAGGLPRSLFLALTGASLLCGQLPAYRVLMVWVYDRTGSLFVAMLMHASLSACTFFFGLSVTGWAFVAYVFALAAAWWMVVVTVVLGQRGRLSQQPIFRAA